MKNFNYETILRFEAKKAVAALYWCRNEHVLVKNGQEVDWLNKPEGSQWKPLWKILKWYPYTTWTWTDIDKPTSQFNFCIGDRYETRGLSELLYEVWFDYIERKYHKVDNKTALMLQNRLTGQIVYLGWYDGKFTVTELEPRTDSSASIVEINED